MDAAILGGRHKCNRYVPPGHDIFGLPALCGPLTRTWTYFGKSHRLTLISPLKSTEITVSVGKHLSTKSYTNCLLAPLKDQILVRYRQWPDSCFAPAMNS